MKPLAEHGTHARAVGRPSQGIPRCPCQPCRQAEYRYDRRRRHLAATGRNLTVPPTAAAQHLQLLRASGITINDISTASKTSRGTIRLLLQGRPAPILRSTANAILAIPHRDLTVTTVPALGSTRRVRALIAIGHTKAHIERVTGVAHTTLWQITAGIQPIILASTADAIARVYEQLAPVPGQSERSRKRAEANGWYGPEAWDRDIDDPAADPGAPEPEATRAHLLAIAEEMTRAGAAAEDIAAAVDRDPRTVSRWRRANNWKVAA
jgi:hypothetical protein